MKAYFHFTEENLLKDHLTVVVVFHDEDMTVDKLCKELILALFKKGYHVNTDSKLCLLNQERRNAKILGPTDIVCQHISENDDIYAKFIPPQQQKKPSDIKLERVQKILDYKGTMETKQQPDGTTKFNPKTVGDWLALADKWRVLGQPRKTLQILTVIIESQSARPEMFEEVVKIYLEGNRPTVAMDFILKGQERFPDYQPFKLRMSDCCMASNDPDRAIEVLLDYTKELRRDGSGTMEQRHEVQVALCKAYQMKGQKDMALVIIHGVVKELQETKKENIDAVIEYARLTYDLSPVQASEATAIILSALIGDKDNKFRQKAFTELCQKPKGLDHLQVALKHAAVDPIALGFFANIIRCHGAIKEAMSMFEKAVTFKPLSAQVILQYIHLLEVVYKYEKAYKVIVQYFEERPNEGVGSLCNRHLYKHIQQTTDGAIYLFGHKTEKSVDFFPIKEEEEHVVKDVYTEDDFYHLALWFTLVKILYLQGATGVLPPLIKLLTPFHKGKELHLTLIRNEAAYFACIKMLCSLWENEPSTQPVIPTADSDCIYMIGNSHCITPAWKQVTWKNKPHVIHPLLSTGTKIWHLRPNSVFYPKVNFENAVKEIPDFSSVIFIFGEIDCREAIVICYEKCKYDSIELAIEVIQDIYVNVMLELQEKHKWKIFVHPVPPVLEVTRGIVLVFNKMLEKRLEREPTLHWLPIQHDLMDTSTPDTTLKSQYEFDNTHLHPSYVSVLEQALNSIRLAEDDPLDID